MTHSRTSFFSYLLAGSGALLFISSISFLALLLSHGTLAGKYEGTYVVAPLWVPIAFLTCTLLVLFGSVTIRRSAHSQTHATLRLTLAAILLTIAAWAIGGISWVVAGL